MLYGYCRCSTEKQTIANQHFEIQKFTSSQGLHVDVWVEETISSRKPLNKRKLGALLDKLSEGDILIATELSRLGRSLLEVMAILQQCLDNGCQVWTIKENYRLGADIQSKVLAFAFGLSAEIERKLISDRTKMSLDKLRSDGKRLGRPLGAKNRTLKLAKNRRRVLMLYEQGFPKAQIARIMNVDKSIMYRFFRLFSPDTSCPL